MFGAFASWSAPAAARILDLNLELCPQLLHPYRQPLVRKLEAHPSTNVIADLGKGKSRLRNTLLDEHQMQAIA